MPLWRAAKEMTEEGMKYDPVRPILLSDTTVILGHNINDLKFHFLAWSVCDELC
jgi:hypothetical protein